MTITKRQFETGYAKRSGVTVKWLKEQGQEARPCDCGEDNCKGWQMINVREDWVINPGPEELHKSRGDVTDRSEFDEKWTAPKRVSQRYLGKR